MQSVSPAPRVPARPATRGAGLSGRELEVLRLVASGYRDRAIAAELAISPRTVTTHITHILAKLGADNRTAAATAAVRSGLA